MIVDYYGMCFANQGARCWHKVFVVLRILPLCMLLRSIWHIVTVIGQGLSGSCAKSAKAHTHTKKEHHCGGINFTNIDHSNLTFSIRGNDFTVSAAHCQCLCHGVGQKELQMQWIHNEKKWYQISLLSGPWGGSRDPPLPAPDSDNM